MDKEPKNLPMETSIKVNTLKANQMDMDNIIGQMEAILKEVLKMD